MVEKKQKPQRKKPKEDEKAPEKEAIEEPVQETPQGVPVFVEPQPPFASLAYPLRVLVSPVKAFQKISVNPDVKGLVLVFGLLLIAAAAMQYAVATKILLNGTGLIATGFFQSYLGWGIFQSFFSFLLSWLLFAGALLLVSTLLGAKGGTWRTFFIIIGYASMIFVLRTAVSTALISTLPQINFNLSTWPPSTEAEVTEANNQINTVWGPALAFQVGPYVNLAFDAWLVILGAIAVHSYRSVNWSRAATISAAAYLIYFTLRLFIGGF